MKNYEKYHVDKMSVEDIKDIAVTKDGAILKCCAINCSDCKFNDLHFCSAALIKWLLEEYKEPETDWSKVPVDTLVKVRYHGESIYRLRYFAGLSKNGKPAVFSYGATSITNDIEPLYVPLEIKLYKEGDE